MPTQRPTRPPTRQRWRPLVVILIGSLVALTYAIPVIRADHEGSNLLKFAAVDGSPSPDAEGSGSIDYRGGAEPVSRWTSTFEFTGLEPDALYVVTVMGRTGEDGSAEAQAFSSICTFRSDAAGSGHCWDYGLGMRRMGVVQLRRDDSAGAVVMQATRGPNETGSIESSPNRFSPATPTALASPPPLLGSPIAG